MNYGSLAPMARSKPLEPLLEHEIRLRAYDLYEQRGRAEGHALEDWLRAEAEILKSIVSPTVGGATVRER